jgi:hypothetical protein
VETGVREICVVKSHVRMVEVVWSPPTVIDVSVLKDSTAPSVRTASVVAVAMAASVFSV